jgi:hypothetical protein
VLSIFALVRPPWWLKPAWLRREEAASAAGQPPVAPPGSDGPGSRLDTLAAWALVIGAVGAWYLFELSPGILVGAAIGVSYLLATGRKAS